MAKFGIVPITVRNAKTLEAIETVERSVHFKGKTAYFSYKGKTRSVHLMGDYPWEAMITI